MFYAFLVRLVALFRSINVVVYKHPDYERENKHRFMFYVML